MSSTDCYKLTIVARRFHKEGDKWVEDRDIVATRESYHKSEKGAKQSAKRWMEKMYGVIFRVNCTEKDSEHICVAIPREMFYNYFDKIIKWVVSYRIERCENK